MTPIRPLIPLNFRPRRPRRIPPEAQGIADA